MPNQPNIVNRAREEEWGGAQRMGRHGSVAVGAAKEYFLAMVRRWMSGQRANPSQVWYSQPSTVSQLALVWTGPYTYQLLRTPSRRPSSAMNLCLAREVIVGSSVVL